MLQQEYTSALFAAATFAKIQLPKNAEPESLVGLAAEAYNALPEANQEQLAAAAEAHHVTVPKDLTSAGLEEAAMAAGTNPKFFAHQLATAAATQGVRLPAAMTEDVTTSEPAAAAGDDAAPAAPKGLPEGAGTKIAASAAARGLVIPIDPLPAGLASAAAASGMAPSDYADALRNAAKAVKVKVKKVTTPERLNELVATAYQELPEANTSQVLAGAEAHNISIPQDLAPAGLADAAKNAGVNAKFFGHQLATAVASQGYRLPASLIDDMLAAAQGPAADSEAPPEQEPELNELEPDASVQRAETKGHKGQRGTKKSSKSRLPDGQDPEGRASWMESGAAASEEVVKVLTAAHFETIAAKDELIKSQAALIAVLQAQIASSNADKELIRSQAELIASLQQQASGAEAPIMALEPA
jgi:hypothetical protein